GTRMLPVSSCAAGSGETLLSSSLAGERLVLGTAARLLAYDLRRAPELPLLGALPSAQAVQTVQTDGTWAYARRAGAPNTYSAWRMGPEAAFTAAGTTTATGWLDGASFGTRHAVRRNGTTVEIRVW
ncbi:MAG: hypothetical protein WKG00_29250, partial [Polyangiaceae bacterium]